MTITHVSFFYFAQVVEVKFASY